MQKLDCVVKYTLSNGFESEKEICERDVEGLNYGFLDIHEVIDINWIIDENDFNKDVYCESWNIEKLAEKDIIYLDF